MAKNKKRNQFFCKRWKRVLKQEVLGWYGGTCVCCGESCLDFLTLDHIDDSGIKENSTLGLDAESNQARGSNSNRKNASTGFHLYNRIRKLGFENRPLILQVLCWNCQWGKRLNNGFCPHHPEKDLRGDLT